MIVDEGQPLLISACIRDHVGIHHAPIRPQHLQDPAKIGEVIAQFDQADQIELPQGFCDVMDGGFGTPNLAEFRADVKEPLIS
jgi:hypothetical protein